MNTSGAAPPPPEMEAGSVIPWHRRWLRLESLVTLLALLVVWSGVLGYLTHQRKRVEVEALQTASDLARGFGESVSRTLEAMDQVFAMLRAFYRADPARFDIQALAPRDQVLNDLTLQIALTDARGMLQASNLGGPAVDLSDREHIRVHLARPAEDFLFVSKPVLGRVSRKWSIQLTRKLFDAHGAMAGVIVISLDPAYFSRFYASFNAPGGAIALVGLDGVFRARAPEMEGSLGAAVSAVTMEQLRGPIEPGTWRGTSSIDATERLYAFRRLDRYGLAVLVGLSAREVFGEFEQESIWFLLMGLGLSGLVVALGQMLIRSRQRLVASQATLSATLENMSQGILMVDVQGRVPVINRRAAELLDLPERLSHPGVAFRNILQWQIDRGEFVPDGSDVDVDAMARAGGLGGPAAYERQRPGGRVLEVQTRLLPDGRAVRTYSDITERRQNELALAAARDAAETASRLRAEFMATMSHEIRTPLNAVVGIAGLMGEADLPPHLRRYAGALREAAETLLLVIDDVLDFSKLDAGRMEVEAIPFEVPALMAGVVDLMELRAVEKGLALGMQVPTDAPVLLGDPGRLRQVLLNLVGNAVKFTEAGRVVVAATMEDAGAGRIRLRIAVRDTGLGIAPEVQARLFEPFAQADGSISRRYGGTGLGLAICRRLMDRMGGTIGVRSVPGEGAEFAFELVLPVGRALPVGGDAMAAGTGRPLRILLAEDNATNRLVAVTRLERMGHHVDAVPGGAEAVQQVQEIAYDLVLMDVMMPGMDGLAATRAIRALAEPVASVPIVALTANVFAEHRDACRAAGMDGFLGKPMTQPALERVLAQAEAGILRRAGGREEAPEETLARLAGDFGAAEATEVLAGFLEEGRAAAAAMQDATAAGDDAGMALAARGLREAADTLGLGALGALAAAAESADAVQRAAAVSALEAALEAYAIGFAQAVRA